MTTDGVAVAAMYANMAGQEEVHQLQEHHLDGIGLLRTEFLFLDAVEAPASNISESYIATFSTPRGTDQSSFVRSIWHPTSTRGTWRAASITGYCRSWPAILIKRGNSFPGPG